MECKAIDVCCDDESIGVVEVSELEVRFVESYRKLGPDQPVEWGARRNGQDSSFVVFLGLFARVLLIRATGNREDVAAGR